MRKAVLVLLFVNIFLMATFKLGDYDTWYHLAAGKYIVTTGSVIHTDPFSYTATERTWSLQSWLAGVLFYGIFSVAGINGLILFNAGLVTAVFFLVYRTMRLSARGQEGVWLAAALVLIAAFSARFRFMVRPHIVEFLCLAAALYVLSLYRATGRNRLFLLPVIQLLWVNVHGSHILGVALPLLYLTGGWVQRLLPGRSGDGTGTVAARPGQGRALLAVTAANALATFLNPGTYQAFVLPFLITGQEQYMRNIGEWQPLRWQHLWGYGLRYTWGFVALVLLAVAGFLRRARSLDITDLGLAVLFLFAAVKGIRLTAEFAIVVAPIVFRNLSGLAVALGARATKALLTGMAVLLAVVIPPLLVLSPTYAFGVGVKEGKFPERAYAFIEENHVPGRVFNSFGFGDYLTWRAFPERKVFIHGRNDVFPPAFYEEYLSAVRSAAGWEQVTSRYGITVALLHYQVADASGSRNVSHLVANNSWIPVYWDQTAVVYLKDVPENSAVIGRWGYRTIKPANFSFRYLAEAVRRSGPKPVLDELDRLIRQSPSNEEAYLARASVYFAIGPDFAERAIADVRAAIKINSRRAVAHAALGRIYAGKGMRREAAEAFAEAVRIDPGDATALAGLREIRDR